MLWVLAAAQVQLVATPISATAHLIAHQLQGLRSSWEQKAVARHQREQAAPEAPLQAVLVLPRILEVMEVTAIMVLALTLAAEAEAQLVLTAQELLGE